MCSFHVCVRMRDDLSFTYQRCLFNRSNHSLFIRNVFFYKIWMTESITLPWFISVFCEQMDSGGEAMAPTIISQLVYLSLWMHHALKSKILDMPYKIGDRTVTIDKRICASLQYIWGIKLSLRPIYKPWVFIINIERRSTTVGSNSAPEKISVTRIP